MLTLLVLAASRYDFKGEDGGDLTGTKLECVDLSAPLADKDRVGYPAFTMDGDLDLFKSVQDLPGIYEVGFVMRRATTKAGKSIPTMRATQLRLQSPLFPADAAKAK